MNIWSIIKRFKYGQLWQLFILSLKYPLFIYPTLKVTSKSFLKAKKEFPETHGKKGKANAYRHTLWNALICFECSKWGKNKNKIVTWAELITDKHEELSPNMPIDTQMDLHNNKIGRTLFLEVDFKNLEEISEKVKEKMTTAKQIATLKEIELYADEMVYISDV